MEEAVGGANDEVAVVVGVGQRKEVGELALVYVYAYLFLDFPDYGFLRALARVNKAADDVECALGRLEGAARNENLPLLVLDDGNSGGSRVVVVGEAAVVTMFGFAVVDAETR